MTTCRFTTQDPPTDIVSTLHDTIRAISLIDRPFFGIWERSGTGRKACYKARIGTVDRPDVGFATYQRRVVLGKPEWDCHIVLK